MKTQEDRRLIEHEKKKKHWRRWGPYLSARQWGTVREDYSEEGSPWTYFPFEQACSRTYRWGEDGIGGISDNHQRLCFAFTFWNEKDPILKERLFGLAGGEGNHGEDVKEYFFYLDNTPTHSYMKFLYKYPHEAFPYEDLKQENQNRSQLEAEYELLDTKIFDQNHYFDLFIEYAKQDAEDVLIKLSVKNRSAKEKILHILPTLWFRNTWSWYPNQEKKCSLRKEDRCIVANHPDLKERYLYFEKDEETLFCENETNKQKLFNQSNNSLFPKDGFCEYVIHKKKEKINPKQFGTKAAIHLIETIPAQESVEFRFRLTNEKQTKDPFSKFETILQKRKKECQKFYDRHTPKSLDGDLKMIQRQAFSSLLWSKQFYHYVVEKWLEGDLENPSHKEVSTTRNIGWTHLYNNDVLSIPDKWEYPWFASWDLAFHTISYAIIDPFFAKRQLTLLTREWYMHPNGEIPSYEWNFSDVTPPVLAWAAWRVYKIEEKNRKVKDFQFLNGIFQKLLLNFTWWVNRKDAEGKNVFQGGFLGLDNISVFNRSEHLPMGATLTQSDATSWMGMYCLNMWTIAVELSKYDRSYQDLASKFFEHFLYIADAINYEKKGQPSLWCDEDGFYFDVLHYADDTHKSIKVHSMVGLIPLLAVAIMEEEELSRMKDFKRRFDWFVKNRQDLCEEIACMTKHGVQDRHILSILNEKKLRKVLSKMLDENEFLSPYGIRSLSKFHKENPYELDSDGKKMKVDYEPGESTTSLFGGNSNWRGPIWFPLNFLIIEALQKYHHYYGDQFKIECPTGSGNFLTLWEVAGEISHRLIKLFTKDEKQHRPIYQDIPTFQEDPNWKDYILFHEYFHAEKGKGLGASHQTGWTALIAKLIQQRGDYFL